MSRFLLDEMVPRCTRGNHYCTELCPSTRGEPCNPPVGDRWEPRGKRFGFRRGSAVANYRLLRSELPPGELTEVQERYLRWLAEWDGETAEAVASLLRLARERTP